MRLVTFGYDGRTAVGRLDGDDIVTLDGVESMLDLIASGRMPRDGARVPRREAAIRAPIPRPAKNILCVGKNYHAHASEFARSGFDASAKEEVPEVPVIFTKLPTSVSDPGAGVSAAVDPTDSMDYEGELCVVIGPGGRDIKAADAFDHVFGYTIINDLTSRELQKRHRQWFIGKSLDGFCPMGPTLVTADEIPDPTRLRLITEVNGERRQDAPLTDLIFDIPTLVETLSAGITLEAGDIIATGTAAGVGIGYTPPRYLQVGDTVAITIEPIGTLETTIVA